MLFRSNCPPAERKLRVAIVYSRLPFPMMRGDQLTVAHLISFLAQRGHAIDFYDIVADGALDSVQSEWLHQACRKVRFYEQGRLAKLAGLAKGLMARLPMQIGIFDNAQLAGDLRAGIDAGDYDIVYCYYPRTAPAIPRRGELGKKVKTFLALQLSQTLDRKSTRLNSSHSQQSRMPSSA